MRLQQSRVLYSFNHLFPNIFYRIFYSRCLLHFKNAFFTTNICIYRSTMIYSNQMISKTALALSALLLLVGLSQALRVDSHNDYSDEEKSFTPVSNLEDFPVLYASLKLLLIHTEINSQSVLTKASTGLNGDNESVYRLTFSTNGVDTTYDYVSSPEQNWPEVITAIKHISHQYPATNLYKINYATSGVKGDNFSVIFDLIGDDLFTQFYAEVGVDSNLTTTTKNMTISCVLGAFGCEEGFALQIFNANNKLFTDHPTVTDIRYDLTSFTPLQSDSEEKILTVEQTLSPREQGDKVIVATISVTHSSFEITYS